MALDEKDIETVKSLIGDANKPITDLLNAQKSAQDELTKNVSILADTLKNAPPAKADDKGDKKPEPLTAEGVTKLVSEALAADRQKQAEQTKQADAVSAAKAKIIKDKLGGDAELGGYLPDTADEAQLKAAADKLATKLTPKAKLPGTGSDGGTPPARQPVDMSKMSPHELAVMGLNQNKASV